MLTFLPPAYDHFMDPFAGANRRGFGYTYLLDDIPMAQSFGRITDEFITMLPPVQRDHHNKQWPNAGTQCISHAVRHSRDASGRETFCERREVGGQHRTLRWDTDDVDERGDVRHHIERGSANGIAVDDAEAGAGDAAFERAWAAAGAGWECTRSCEQPAFALHSDTTLSQSAAPATGHSPYHQPQAHQQQPPPQRQPQPQKPQPQPPLVPAAPTAVYEEDKQGEEGYICDTPDSDDDEECKPMENDDATPLFEARMPGQL